MIFRKPYTIRHYGNQVIRNGYPTQGYIEETAYLDIQPSSDTMSGPEAGFDTVMRITVYGDYPFTPANQDEGVKADRVFWQGHWFECTSSMYWDGTPLHHWISTFSIVPDGGEDLEYRGPTLGSV